MFAVSASLKTTLAVLINSIAYFFEYHGLAACNAKCLSQTADLGSIADSSMRF